MMYAKNKTTKETAAYEIVCRQMKQVVKASNVRGWRQEEDSFLPLNLAAAEAEYRNNMASAVIRSNHNNRV